MALSDLTTKYSKASYYSIGYFKVPPLELETRVSELGFASSRLSQPSIKYNIKIRSIKKTISANVWPGYTWCRESRNLLQTTLYSLSADCEAR
jgi:hypothetical protein